MAGKETVRAKLDRLRGRSSRGEKVSVDASALLRFADGGIHFLLSAVLAGAAVFGDYAPFGVALVGAAGSGVCGAAALVGACFGYLTLLGFTGGLRYISASMLTFAVNFAFYDVKLLRKPWAMPMVAGLFNGVTGFIYLSEAGWRTEDVIYFLHRVLSHRGRLLVLPAAPPPPAHRPGGGGSLPPEAGQPGGAGLHGAHVPVLPDPV